MQQYKFDSAWLRGLWSQGEGGNVLPKAELHKGLSCLKDLYAWSCCFLQQAHMFCPIFLSTIPPYIRPVISWVVTVRAHSASALTLLHQPTEGEQRRERGREGERKTLAHFLVPERHEVSVWCERDEGGSESGGRIDESRSYHIHRFWGSFESLLHKTLSRFSSTQLFFWKTCKQGKKPECSAYH